MSDAIDYDALARGKDQVLRDLAIIVMSEQTGSRWMMASAQASIKEILDLRSQVEQLTHTLKIEQAPKLDTWEPIETAPKDGTRILLFQVTRGAFEGWWHNNWPQAEQYWMDDADSEPDPTYWRPLLIPPVASTERRGSE